MSDASMRHCLACGEPEYACECKSFVDDHDLVLLRVKHAALVEAARSVLRWYERDCPRHVDEFEKMERWLINEPRKALDDA